MFLVTQQMCEEAPAAMIFFPTGSLRVWHDTAVHDEHQLILQGEEVWNHQLQVWLTVINVKCPDMVFNSNIFQTQVITFTGVSLPTGETRPVWRKERKDTKTEHPENQRQRGGPTVPPINLRKPNTRSNLLRRTSCLWANGVPPFHATRDSVTPPSSPPKEPSRGIISLSRRTIKSVGVATQVTGSGLDYEEPIVGPNGKTAGVPIGMLDQTKDLFWENCDLKGMLASVLCKWASMLM